MIFRVLPAALGDALAAASWYEDQRIGLGKEFLDELQESRETIRHSPESHPRHEKGKSPGHPSFDGKDSGASSNAGIFLGLDHTSQIPREPFRRLFWRLPRQFPHSIYAQKMGVLVFLVWKAATVCGVLAAGLALAALMVYEPNAAPPPHACTSLSGLEKIRLTVILPGYWCWLGSMLLFLLGCMIQLTHCWKMRVMLDSGNEQLGDAA